MSVGIHVYVSQPAFMCVSAWPLLELFLFCAPAQGESIQRTLFPAIVLQVQDLIEEAVITADAAKNLNLSVAHHNTQRQR